MKRFFFSSISLMLMLTVMTLGVSAEAYNQDHTPRATHRFVEYLSSLDTEQAYLLLIDPEMIYMMLMDYYWKPYETYDAFSRFAKNKCIQVQLIESHSNIKQNEYLVLDLTVEQLSNKLRHQVIQKTDKSHKHEWMYFDVTDKDGAEMLFRTCQTCEKWQAFDPQ